MTPSASTPGPALARPPPPLARRPAQPPDVDLRLHRLRLRPAAVPAAQPGAGLAEDRGAEPQGHRRLRPDPVSLHLEVPVVALPGALRPAAAPARAGRSVPGRATTGTSRCRETGSGRRRRWP